MSSSLSQHVSTSPAPTIYFQERSFFSSDGKRANEDISDRQRKILNVYLDGKEAKITAKNWSRLGAVSLDTAIRDIRELEDIGILSPLPGRVHKIEYAINYVKTDMFLKRFCYISVEDG